VTIDEELDLLDQQLRRLKIEYEMFFNNPAKRPPTDIEWKVLNLLRKFSDGTRMRFAQRYRYNAMAQRYAIQSDLWRKKMRIREEGYRRPQEAILSVQGVQGKGEREPKFPIAYGLKHKAGSATGAKTADSAEAETSPAAEAFEVQCSDVAAERKKVESLYKALTTAQEKAGEKVSGSLASFTAFVHKKTTELRKEHGCAAVVYSVEMQDGKVRLRAKAKD